MNFIFPSFPDMTHTFERLTDMIQKINNTALINLDAKITAIHYLASLLFMYLQTIEIMSHLIRKSHKNITMEECFLLCIHAHFITIAFENNKLYAQIYTRVN